MSTLKIGTKENCTAFRPGDTIEGAVGWDLTVDAKVVEVRLFWQTRGKGTEDVEVVEQVRFENPEVQDAQSFRFTAPEQPYSFSGKLVSVIWGIEVIVTPGKSAARMDIVIAPHGHEIVLSS